MKSYTKLMEEINALQEQRKSIEVDKINILMPLYEIQNKYEKNLGEILPKNIYSISPKNLELRIGVFEEEIKDLDISVIEKEKIIKIILNAKEKFQEKNKETDQTNNEIIKKGPEIQKRKEYVLEKSKEKELLEKEIKEIKTKINDRYLLLEKESWDQEVVHSINEIITRLRVELNEKIKQLNILLKDPELIRDIELLVLVENKEENNEESVKKDDDIQEEKEKASEIPEVLEEQQNISEESPVVSDKNLKENFYDTLSESNIKQNDNVVEEKVEAPEIPEVAEEQQNISEESPVVSDKNLKEKFFDALLALESLVPQIDDSLDGKKEDTQDSHEIERIFEEKSDDEDFRTRNSLESESYVEEIYDNPQLEEHLKENKTNRIKLGVQTIIARLFYNPKKIMDDSERLSEEALSVLRDSRDDMTIEDAETIREKSLEVIEQENKIIENMENGYQLSELSELKKLNSSLDKTLGNVYLKDEFGEYDKPLIRMK